MTQWFVLFKKEWLEMTRNYKLLWLPLVFILFGILQPVTSYYLPVILETTGDLPEGTVMDIPLPAAAEVLVGTLGQYSQLGVLILTLAFMGVIAGERSSGVQEMILVKPVSYLNYITSKWASMSILGLGSLLLGMISSAYYTHLLIGEVRIVDAANGTLVYAVWLLFLLTVTIFFSSFLKSSGLVATFTIVIAIGLSALTSLLGKWMTWSPGKLTGHAASFITSGNAGDAFLLSLFMTFGFILILLWGSVNLLKRVQN